MFKNECPVRSYLEKALAALARAHAVMLTSSRVTTDCAKSFVVRPGNCSTVDHRHHSHRLETHCLCVHNHSLVRGAMVRSSVVVVEVLKVAEVISSSSIVAIVDRSLSVKTCFVSERLLAVRTWLGSGGRNSRVTVVSLLVNVSCGGTESRLNSV